MNTRQRREIILSLGPGLEQALALAQNQLTLDPTGAEVVLTRQHIVLAIEKYRSGEIPAEVLELWAETVHTAEDVDFEDRDFVAQAIFEISTPELHGTMDAIVARFLP